MIFYSLLSFLLFLFTTQKVQAIYDPLSVPNNKFGIHLADINNLAQAKDLVNSSGGDWGYVTFVIPESDRNSAKWQDVFNQLRRYHLIPLVRIASRVEGDTWTIPDPSTIPDWVSFLESLNWPTENRSIILYNEPNHAKEWGGSVDPEGYARVFTEFALRLKETSGDYFILPAALDVSAESDGLSLDAAVYLKRMVTSATNFFDLIDGWNSHSYPNPGFSGSPYAKGRGTLTSYKWELTYLKQLGLSRELPVFITETGWQHSEGKYVDRRLLAPDTVGRHMSAAIRSVWNDSRIVAVTPFVFSYLDYPFDHFSWKKLDGNQFYSFYEEYKNYPKTQARPRRRHVFALENAIIPDKLVQNSSYSLRSTLVNSGQSILETDHASLVLVSHPNQITSFFDTLPELEPGQSGQITVHFKTPDAVDDQRFTLALVNDDAIIELEEKIITLVPPPSLNLTLRLGWKKAHTATGIKILLYDEHNTLIHKFEDLNTEDGTLVIRELYNVVPGKDYRIVVVVPHYLPRQTVGPVSFDETPVSFERFLPLDFDEDGALTLKDLRELFLLAPQETASLFF